MGNVEGIGHSRQFVAREHPAHRGALQEGAGVVGERQPCGGVQQNLSLSGLLLQFGNRIGVVGRTERERAFAGERGLRMLGQRLPDLGELQQMESAFAQLGSGREGGAHVLLITHPT